MADNAILGAIRGLIVFLIEQGWKLVAMLADFGRLLGPFTSGLVLVVLGVIAYSVALVMQMRLERKLKDEPGESVSIWWQELIFSLPAAMLFVVMLPVIIVASIVRGISRLISSLTKSDEDEKQDEEGEEEEEEVPILVATIGPSFMWAGVSVAALYVLATVTEPLLAAQLGVSDGHSAWQFLLIGSRPELQWYLPLDRFPFLGGLAAFLFWFTIWWWAGRITRIVLRHEIGNNLAAELETFDVLPSWRTWFGARDLHKLDDSYQKWSKWLPLVALPLLMWSWVSVGGDPYRMEGSMFAVGTLVWLSWAIHMSLSGFYKPVDEEVEDEEDAPPEVYTDWGNVLDDLDLRHQVTEPYVFDQPRQVPGLDTTARPKSNGLVSELLFGRESGGGPLGDGGLTAMQVDVLETLSRQAFVHVDPPSAAGSLELKKVSGSAISNESGLRHRNQVVLAPDGSGKTTLAMLAAFNNTLVHSRGTLIVVRDEGEARALAARMRDVLEPSTLRWTIRTRLAGPALVSDLSKGMIPDVVVASLEQLVTGILDDPRTYTGMLSNLGLIVVDDVQSFCGPMETHMQLAFRRLRLRLRDVQGTRQLAGAGDPGYYEPVALVLGVDSMFDTATWARTLCGIDAVTRVYDYSASRERVAPGDLAATAPETPTQIGPAGDAVTADETADAQSANDDSAEKAAALDAQSQASASTESAHSRPAHGETDSASSNGVGRLTHAKPGRYHLFYQLSDFVTESGEQLGISELIKACERVGVAWHYRRCGDVFRSQGRSLLRLAEEPMHDVEDPADAGVVFLEGPASTVRREIDHLLRAGVRYASDKEVPDAPIPIAFISIVDSDERMALTEMDPNSSLASAINTFPRPIVRAPSGRAVEAHLSADLVNTWMEVSDILDVFGTGTVRTLDHLSRAGLVAERSTDLDANQSGYENLLRVRLPAKAVAPDEETYRNDRAGHLLPPRVRQVELPPGPRVAIRDHTSLTTIAHSDMASARYVYYTGRILETAQGRYIVVGTAGDEVTDDSPLSEHDILVEPFLNDDISAPRRRTFVRPLRPGEVVPGERENDDDMHREAEPVFIGDFPVATTLDAFEVDMHHLATFRLDPRDLRVRQRVLFFGPEKPTTERATIRTEALGILPNPDMEVVREAGCPRLEVRDARLIAATMRAVLLSMYRGSEVDLDVALHIEAPNPEPTHVLGPKDGFYVFDPHVGGTGAARAIARDGVELLLRLCRLYLERVLFHERLRARFDWWADEAELLGRQARHRSANAAEQREADQRARKRALTWLDSRLRPEGSASGGRRRGRYGIGSEEGEGDIFDIGRCWYSADGRVTDLVWTKHRWLSHDGTEAMCDVGIGRKTAAESRVYTASTPSIDAHLLWLRKQLENPAFRMDNQVVWGGPDTVWSVSPGDSVPVGSDANLLKSPELVEQHILALAAMCDSYRALGPLAELLRNAFEERAGEDVVLSSRDLARIVADFVQGIPFSSSSSPSELQGPLEALLRRLGNHTSQSLLLAALLEQLGVDSGVFVHPSTGRMLGAAALADAGERDSTETMLEWRAEHLGPDQKLMWAELPPQPGATRGRRRLFVPIEVKGREDLGFAKVRNPEEWVFLPLVWAWVRIGIESIEVPGVPSAPARTPKEQEGEGSGGDA